MWEKNSYAIAELEKASGFGRRTIVYYIQQGLLSKVGRRGPHTRYPAETLDRLRFIRGVRDLQASGELPTVSLDEMRRLLGLLDATGVRGMVSRGMPPADLAALCAQAVAAPPEAALPGPPAPPANPPPGAPARPADPPARPMPAPRPSADGRRDGLADASIRYRPGPAADALPAPLAADDTHPRLPALTASPLPPAPVVTPDSPASAAGTDAAEGEMLGLLLRRLDLQSTLNRQRVPPGGAEQWTEIPLTSRIYLSVRGLAAEDAVLVEEVARALRRVLRA